MDNYLLTTPVWKIFIGALFYSTFMACGGIGFLIMIPFLLVIPDIIFTITEIKYFLLGGLVGGFVGSLYIMFDVLKFRRTSLLSHKTKV